MEKVSVKAEASGYWTSTVMSPNSNLKFANNFLRDGLSIN